MAYSDQSLWSQADQRSFRKFTDQHGRIWQADVENKTQHPCGPLSPAFSAPLKVPSKYIKIADTAGARLEIQYDRWIQDLTATHQEYEARELEEATKLYGDRGAEVIQKGDDRALRFRMGKPPEKIERILAAKAGNRWVLGIKNPKTGQPEPKPAWADLYFPKPVEPTIRTFPNADEEFANEDKPEESTAFPHMSSPGRWHLSAEHRDEVLAGNEPAFKGNREQAEQAAALRIGETPTTHTSWSAA